MNTCTWAEDDLPFRRFCVTHKCWTQEIEDICRIAVLEDELAFARKEAKEWEAQVAWMRGDDEPDE